MSNRSISLVTLVVREYDPAIQFFVKTLGFSLIEDTELGDGKRWVVVAAGASGASLLLARSKIRRKRKPLDTRPVEGLAFSSKPMIL